MINILKAQKSDKELLNFILSDDIFQYIIESVEYANIERLKDGVFGLYKSISSYLDECSKNIIHQIWLVFGSGTDSLSSTCDYIHRHGLVKFIEKGLV